MHRSLGWEQRHLLGPTPLDLDLDLVTALSPGLGTDLKLGVCGQLHLLIAQDKGAGLDLGGQRPKLLGDLFPGEYRLGLAALLPAFGFQGALLGFGLLLGQPFFGLFGHNLASGCRTNAEPNSTVERNSVYSIIERGPCVKRGRNLPQALARQFETLRYLGIRL